MAKELKITLIKSVIGQRADMKRTVEALGLHRIHHTVQQKDTPAMRGMLTKVRHLITVEEV